VPGAWWQLVTRGYSPVRVAGCGGPSKGEYGAGLDSNRCNMPLSSMMGVTGLHVPCWQAQLTHSGRCWWECLCGVLGAGMWGAVVEVVRRAAPHECAGLGCMVEQRFVGGGACVHARWPYIRVKACMKAGVAQVPKTQRQVRGHASLGIRRVAVSLAGRAVSCGAPRLPSSKPGAAAAALGLRCAGEGKRV
jgi:hypothetical protein